MVAAHHIGLAAFRLFFPLSNKRNTPKQQYYATPKALYGQGNPQATEYKQAKAQPGEQQREEREKHGNNPNLPQGN